jgi:hypothetical protein
VPLPSDATELSVLRRVFGSSRRLGHANAADHTALNDDR